METLSSRTASSSRSSKSRALHLAQLGLVALEDVGDALAVGILGAEVILLRIDHVVLGPGDAAQNRARGELLGVQAHALHDLLDDGLLVVLVVDGKGAGQAFLANLERLDVAAQDAHAKRVEGAEQRLGQRGVVQQPVDALGHLAGGLVGEGDGQNRVRRDAFLADQPGDAAGDDAGLARAGSGEDQQGAFGGLDGGALFGIQVGELRRQDGIQAGRVLSLVYRSGCQRAECSPSSARRVCRRFPITRC